MHSPLTYYGGKWRLAPWIIQHFPPHDTYIEPCGGVASVLIQKEPVSLEIYNDLESHVVNFFRCLRNQPEALIRSIYLTPYAREEWETCKTPSDDPLEDARRFFVGCWMSISSTPFEGAIGWRSKTYAGQGFTHHTKTFRQAEDTLTEVAERFRYVQIEHRTYQELLARHDRLGTLIYLDPPYVQETRTQKKQYLCEWTKEEHRQLAEIVRACQSYIIISGYACPLYTELFEDAGWQRRDRKSQTQHGFRIESLWLNPQTSEALNLPTQTTIFDQIKT